MRKVALVISDVQRKMALRTGSHRMATTLGMVDMCRKFQFPVTCLSCVMGVSWGARVFVVWHLVPRRRLSGLVFHVFTGQELRR